MCEQVEQELTRKREEWERRIRTLRARRDLWPVDDPRRQLWKNSGIKYAEPCEVSTTPDRLAELEEIVDRIDRQHALEQRFGCLYDSQYDALDEMMGAAHAAGELPVNCLRRVLNDQQLDLLEWMLDEIGAA